MASATAADLMAMKSSMDGEMQDKLLLLKNEIEGNARVEIDKAVTKNADSQQALIKRLEELLEAGNKSMTKQQEIAATLVDHQAQAAEHIKLLVSTFDDTTTKTSSMEENLQKTLQHLENKYRSINNTTRRRWIVVYQLHANVIELGKTTQERMQA